MRRLSAIVLVPSLLAAPLWADGGWLPPQARDALVGVIAPKLEAIDTENRLTPERIQETARAAVDGLAAKIGSLGTEGVIGLAPAYPRFELPTSGSAALDAIVAYQLCSLPMDATYGDATPREHRYDERAWALFLAFAVYLVSGYLRQSYLAEGVTDEQAQALLAGEAMSSLKQRIATSQELLDYTRLQCGDPLIELMH